MFKGGDFENPPGGGGIGRFDMQGGPGSPGQVVISYTPLVKVTREYLIDPLNVTFIGQTEHPNLIVPPGVTSMTAILWGGGGGADYFGSNPFTNAGGGGGEYVKHTFSVTPGDSVQARVGRGGTSRTSTTAPLDGIKSSVVFTSPFGVIVEAEPGKKGSPTIPSVGGAGGSNGTGVGTRFPGGQGGQLFQDYYAGGGGAGGSSEAGKVGQAQGTGDGGSKGVFGELAGGDGVKIDPYDVSDPAVLISSTVPGGGGGVYNGEQPDPMMPPNAAVSIDGADGKVILCWFKKPPVAVDDGPFTLCPGGSIEIDVAANDYDPDQELLLDSVTIVTQPQHGTVTLYPGDGVVTYTHNGTSTSPTDSFQYSISDYDGFCDTATVSLSIVQRTITVTGTKDVCAGGSTTLTATATGSVAGDTFAWSTYGALQDGTIASSTAQSTEVTPTEESTVYTVTVTTPEGCEFDASCEVTVLPQPQVSISGPKQVCPGESLQLTADVYGAQAQTYAWTESGGGSTIDDTMAATVTVSPTAPTTNYSVSVTTTEGCEATSEECTVTVFQALQVEVSGDKEVCLGNSTQLSADVTGGASVYSYAWSTYGGLQDGTIDDLNAQSTVVTPTGPTEYTVAVTSTDGCVFEASCLVEVYEVSAQLEGAPAPPADADTGLFERCTKYVFSGFSATRTFLPPG